MTNSRCGLLIRLQLCWTILSSLYLARHLQSPHIPLPVLMKPPNYVNNFLSRLTNSDIDSALYSDHSQHDCTSYLSYSSAYLPYHRVLPRREVVDQVVFGTPRAPPIRPRLRVSETDTATPSHFDPPHAVLVHCITPPPTIVRVIPLVIFQRVVFTYLFTASGILPILLIKSAVLGRILRWSR